MASERWEQVDQSLKAQIAPLACTASWALNSWDRFKLYVSALPEGRSYDAAFYRTVFAIHEGQYSKACEHIRNARNIIDGDLTATANESYDRAYIVSLTVFVPSGDVYTAGQPVTMGLATVCNIHVVFCRIYCALNSSLRLKR